MLMGMGGGGGGGEWGGGDGRWGRGVLSVLIFGIFCTPPEEKPPEFIQTVKNKRSALTVS